MDTTPLTDLVTRIGRFEESLRLARHWGVAAYAGAQGADPGFPEFDPVDVPRLLPFLYLLERDGARLRYRVAGENVNRLFGSQLTGRHLDEVVPAASYQVVAPYFHGVFEGQPCLFKGSIVLPQREFMEFERLLLPVTRQGRRLLLGLAGFSTTATLRSDPPDHPGPGFHFHTVGLHNGTVESAWVDMTPNLHRAEAL